MKDEYDENMVEESLLKIFNEEGYELKKIKNSIDQKLSENDDFKAKYKIWTENSIYKNWKEFYKEDKAEMESEKDAEWESMFSNDDDDDAITDFMAQE